MCCLRRFIAVYWYSCTSDIQWAETLNQCKASMSKRAYLSRLIAAGAPLSENGYEMLPYDYLLLDFGRKLCGFILCFVAFCSPIHLEYNKQAYMKRLFSLYKLLAVRIAASVHLFHDYIQVSSDSEWFMKFMKFLQKIWSRFSHIYK